MRTAFFVDGYNLFYGLLAGTPYKWLNLKGLLAHVAHIENPQSSIISVDYFTSKLEEKETDVHIAISMYRTATKQAALEVHDRIEQLALASSDTDMTPALKAIREDFPDITIGVILPHRAELNCPSPGSLKEHSHWMRRVISAEELQSHQFPERVPTRKTPAIKPDYW
ncbi:NYN domain-containing protein [Pseudomonas fluorescens]|uniref:NYN domain-containing protein n=1 Tax=Pseudomonas fluorescens TaxID=294 RepID=UPI0009BBC702|nr:NYN domain-containing protein [Pseudomonas fluorescens]